MTTPHFQPDIVISEPTAWQAGEAPTIPTYVEPCLPAIAPPTFYDESPTFLRVELERKALSIIRDKLDRIDMLTDKLDAVGSPADSANERIQRVWNGVFHTDAKGQRLIRFLDSHGPNQLQYMMQTGEFDQDKNGGYVQRQLRQLGSGTTRIFMVHESIPSLTALYDHPDNVAQVDAQFERQRDHIASELAQEKQNLADYKAAVKRDLAELDKRMSQLLK